MIKYLYLAASLAGLFGTAFWLGRATRKPEVQYIETAPPAPTVLTKTVIRRSAATTKTVYRTVDVAPDGSSRTVESEREVAVVEEGTDATSKQDAPVVPPRGPSAPGLFGESTVRVGLLAGVDVSARTGVLGAELERRLFGPVWGSVWGLSSGQVGVGIKGEW